jgi:hypothetical protein
MSFSQIATVVFVGMASALPALGQSPSGSGPRPVAGVILATAKLGPMILSDRTLNFVSADPDSGTVASPEFWVLWPITQGNHGNTWNLTVALAGISGCGNSPVSAFRVVCTSATVTGSGGTGACATPFQLSSTPQVVAAGRQPNGGGIHRVTLHFQFTDSWKYVPSGASQCELELAYIANALPY